MKTDLQFWRNLSHGVDVSLKSESVVCRVGADCTRTNENDGTIEDPPIVLDLQEGDWLNIQLLENNIGQNANESIQYRLINTTRDGSLDCMEMTSSQTVDEWRPGSYENYTVKFDLFIPGITYLKIGLKSTNVQCELVWALKVTTRSLECVSSPTEKKCSGKGICIADSEKSSFTCQCCPGYIGRYCEERDGCHGNPCNHGGFCVDITEGLVDTTYQCLCPHGYHGQSCDDVVYLCDSQPCLNNATCWGNQTAYSCGCQPGFTGKKCEININECLSNPCVHGVCEDGVGGYKCYCLTGYGGDHCEFEYDECDSSPCINSGACEDLVAGYKCHCGPGYKGRRCQVKIDLCESNPCPSPAQCVDKGNNYSCICHPGYNGAGCTQHFDPCYPNPCENGGKCWPRIDSFFCSCSPGYTGETCTAEFSNPAKPMAHTQGRTEQPLEGISASSEHVHSVYIAVSTLAGACLVVVIVITLCHFRVHKFYQRFVRKYGRSRVEIKKQKFDDPDKFSLNLQENTSTFRPFSDSVYEATTIDLTDNLDRPLIA
ncbi:delta and Notch-like epidermal growth factor-related receptor [Limulus polyphemus]|uniref:Delta and Notch-like epidermal growth factor-related receptor n=1 Tax=Limulus polyphemus TaxID=6850 RepID=A0ABM1SDW4_LIMPO|nr:delta and Notch-like epidermal growth factor-related receptor [Limulus polyphemus]